MRRRRQSENTVLLCEQGVVELLRSRPTFSVCGREAVEAQLRQAYGVVGVDFPDSEAPVFAVSGKVATASAGLCFSRFDAAASVGFPALDGYRQALCLSGKGRITTPQGSVEITPDVSCIIPPQTPFTAEYSDNYRHLVLQFDPSILAQKIELVTGALPREPLDLPLMAPLPVEEQRRVKTVALTLAGLFDETATASDLATAELSQALVTVFLQENFAGFADHASGRTPAAGGHEANLLEDYIDTHWNQALTIEDIAEACGVSVRSVYARFKQKRGLSPAGYLRDVRLSNARNLLLSPAGGSVIDVAMRCGFASTGHFARRYREKYGELPSATLARRPVRSALPTSTPGSPAR